MSLLNIEYTGNDGLNYDFLIKQHEKYETYNSRPILCKLRTSNFQNSNNENSIQPNKASHIIAYFANNNDRDQNFIKQRENRWKHNHQKIAMSLANHNNEKISNIENVNINEDFPLIQNHFIFCFYGKKICVGQVLALYYKNYSNYSFNTKPVTKIDDISKVTLKVFLPINSNLFTQYTPEEYTVEFNTEIPRTHNGVNIANNITKLREEEKKKRGQAPCKQCHLSEKAQTQKVKYNQIGKVKNYIISAEAKELKLLPITEVYYSSRKQAEKKRRARLKNSPESISIYLNEMFIAERNNKENKETQETERIKNLNRNIILAPKRTSQVIQDIESSLEEFDNFEIYTDRLLNGNRKKTKIGDTDTLTTDIKRMGIGTRVTGTPLSTRAELWVILLAIKMLPFSTSAVIKTDSQMSIDAIKNFNNNRRQKAWKRYKNSYILQTIIKLTKEKKLTIVYCKIKAHNRDYKNEEADKLAKWGTLQSEKLQLNYDLIDKKIYHKWNNRIIDLPIKEIIKINTKVKRQTE
ncbi:hypothetical protein Glove_578g27 [Diversispora epigaea]|uniref:RNase H type-1 domain-containing protein n=1 Tax=Diversispora epigaea TaxID=1348612 RepID=A0A397GHP8_9GLOM|nr:hypothetical protein Glove_578g27 [Diversispora epigaea]